jgi:hypothetical protein
MDRTIQSISGKVFPSDLARAQRLRCRTSTGSGSVGMSKEQQRYCFEDRDRFFEERFVFPERLL